MSPAARRLRIGAVLAIAWATQAGSAEAQGTHRIATILEPDSVRVGEPFTLGITLSRSIPGEVRFPAVLELPDDVEQRGAVRIRSLEDGGEWRAYYPLVAWSADTLTLPPIALDAEGLEGVELVARPPALTVTSVLPADPEIALRDARPFLRLSRFAWWWLLALAALALAFFWWRVRRRVQPEGPALPDGPAGRALREFARLREAWLDGELVGDQFFDGYEQALRTYARQTRGWEASRGLLGLGGRDPALLQALRRSLLVRFARLRPDDRAPLSALDAGEAFVRSESGEDGTTDDGGTVDAAAGEGGAVDAAADEEASVRGEAAEPADGARPATDARESAGSPAGGGREATG